MSCCCICLGRIVNNLFDSSSILEGLRVKTGSCGNGGPREGSSVLRLSIFEPVPGLVVDDSSQAVEGWWSLWSHNIVFFDFDGGDVDGRDDDSSDNDPRDEVFPVVSGVIVSELVLPGL